MTRRLILLTTVTVLACIASLTLAAGKSAVADAVQKGDNAALRALLLVKTDVNAAQVDGDRADASRDFYADCSLIVSGERAVCGDSFAEGSLGDRHGFDFPRSSVGAGTSLPLRGLVITLA